MYGYNDRNCSRIQQIQLNYACLLIYVRGLFELLGSEKQVFRIDYAWDAMI